MKTRQPFGSGGGIPEHGRRALPRRARDPNADASDARGTAFWRTPGLELQASLPPSHAAPLRVKRSGTGYRRMCQWPLFARQVKMAIPWRAPCTSGF